MPLTPLIRPDWFHIWLFVNSFLTWSAIIKFQFISSSGIIFWPIINLIKCSLINYFFQKLKGYQFQFIVSQFKISLTSRKMFHSTTLIIAARTLKGFKLLGFIPVTIVNDKSVTKPIDIVCLISSISLGAFICIFSLMHRKEFASSKSEIADNGNFVTFFMSIVISMISVINSFIFRHENWSLVVQLTNIEKRVSIS